jgi:hypothetical protein
MLVCINKVQKQAQAINPACASPLSLRLWNGHQPNPAPKCRPNLIPTPNLIEHQIAAGKTC